MTQRLILASNNAGKLKEFSEILGPIGFTLHPQGEFNVPEAEEPHATFVENALEKARHAARATRPGVPMSKRRVVITGLGILSPLGNDLASSWQGIVDGRSGIGPITNFDASAFATRIAGEVTGFDPLTQPIIADFAAVLPMSKLATAVGCHSFTQEPCAWPFDLVGLNWVTGSQTPSTQKLLRATP